MDHLEEDVQKISKSRVQHIINNFFNSGTGAKKQGPVDCEKPLIEMVEYRS